MEEKEELMKLLEEHKKFIEFDKLVDEVERCWLKEKKNKNVFRK